MAKITTVFAALICIFTSLASFSQDEQHDFKYRRSSLAMILIESDDFPNKNAVMASWKSYPFPDKYNNHDIGIRSFDPKKLVFSSEDLLHAGYTDTLKDKKQIDKAIKNDKRLHYLNEEKTMALVLPDEKKDYELKINKLIKEEKIGHKLVAKWFNQAKDGSFDMRLIQERGYYNATEMEAEIAKGQSRGMASLADAGEELIKNTFVTFTKLEFYENEPVARVTREIAIEAANNISNPLGREAAIATAKAAYEKAKEGYSLWSKTWLYRLNWNDSIAAVFYSELWNDPEAFEKTDIFTLELVAVQFNQSLVSFSLKGKRTQEQQIDLATVRNIDNAFAQLQRDYDVFKPKVPVLSESPITAQIGMKEGLSGGEKFEILEMVINEKTQLTEYRKIGVATVDKKLVWDNRYNAGLDLSEDGEESDAAAVNLKATTFKGPKKVYSGMLLRQLK